MWRASWLKPVVYGRIGIYPSMASRRREKLSNAVKQIIVLMLLGGSCALIVPMPQMVPASSGKDLSEPFPCQNRPCGCNSADQCWKQCCCFNNREKVAWANKNAVSLPGFVVKAANEELKLSAKCNAVECDQQSGISSLATTIKSGISKLSSQTVPTTRDPPSGTEVKTCDHCVEKTPVENESVDGTYAAAKNAGESQSKMRYVLGISALECKGLNSLWQILSLSMLTERAVHFVGPNDRCSRLYFDVAKLSSCELPPPDPPPRILGVDCFLA